MDRPIPKARERILNRLRKEADRRYDIEAKPAPPKFFLLEENHAINRAKFVDALSENRIEVIETNRNDWLTQLCQLSTDNKLNHWLIGDHEYTPRIKNSLTSQYTNKVTVYDRPYSQIKDLLFDQIDVSLSFAEAGLIETGSLVVRSTASEPRMLSLIAPVNVIICHCSSIYSNLAHYLAELKKEEMLDSSNLIAISSPSKTADIQQQLAYGAHGPKRVIAMLI